MSLKTNQDAIATFKINLEGVKSTSLIKHSRIEEKTTSYVNIIEQYKESYSTGSDTDILHASYVEYCNNILTFFVGLDSQFLEHWS